MQEASQVRESDNIIVFTGAGISTACGIPDFRYYGLTSCPKTVHDVLTNLLEPHETSC